MNEEIREYIVYLSRFLEIKKPKMPNFDISAYTDNEYTLAIDEIMNDFSSVDDLYLTLEYLKGN